MRLLVPRFVWSTLVPCLLLAFLGGALFAPPAFAHGGRFIPPMPPLGPPSAPRLPDLTPPPSVPGGGPPSVTPGPIAPPTVRVPHTPRGGGSPFTRPAGRRAVARTGDPNSSWETWWNLNRLHVLPDRDTVWLRQTFTETPGGPDRGAYAKRRAATAQAHVVPFLLGLLGPKAKTRDDVRSSALLALGKITNDPASVPLLLARIEDTREAAIVRESAALACGLLRRTDAAYQLSATLLDDLREELIRIADQASVPVRTRAFCILSLGLLGDQPFGSAFSKDGRLVTRALWQRLERPWRQRDLPVALITALGMQPVAGVPDGVREGLRRMVLGKSVHGRRWDSIERGHVLSALLRLGGPEAVSLLLRALRAPREHRDVKRAAYLALGDFAARLDTEQRIEVTKALEQGLKRNRDPLTRGLAHLGLGHLLGADLRAGSGRVLQATGAGRKLTSEARNGSTATRGFSILGLAMACRDLHRPRDRDATLFLADTRTILTQGIERERGDPSIRSAYAVAVGLCGLKDNTGTLRQIVEKRGAPAGLRGYAAVALGQLGTRDPATERVLQLALADQRNLELRSQAAGGGARRGGRRATTQLLRQLETGKTERLLAQVVVALGRLGDLASVHPLAKFAKEDGHGELSRSLAVVALGLLVDPESRPSLVKLTWGSYYPARTESLDEAFTIL